MPPKETPVIEKKSVGEVIFALARRALAPPESKLKTRNGIPLLKVRKGGPRITSGLVHRLREKLP